MSRRLISTGSHFETAIGYSRAFVQGSWCFLSGVTTYDSAAVVMPEGSATQAKVRFSTLHKSLAGVFSGVDSVRTLVIADLSLVEITAPRA